MNQSLAFNSTRPEAGPSNSPSIPSFRSGFYPVPVPITTPDIASAEFFRARGGDAYETLARRIRGSRPQASGSFESPRSRQTIGNQSPRIRGEWLLDGSPLTTARGGPRPKAVARAF